MIIGGLEPDFNKNWISKLPAPQFNWPHNIYTSMPVRNPTRYISALYWSHMATTHVGVGDVTGITPSEKIWSCFMIFLSVFSQAFIIANLVTLVEELIPEYQSVFEGKVQVAVEFLRRNRLKRLELIVNKYFGYLWKSDHGLDEKELLNELPRSLRLDIQFKRYEKIIQNTFLFRDENGFNSSIAAYFFDKC